MSPMFPQSAIQGELVTELNTFARPLKLGRALPDLRVVFGGSALVPDISFFTYERLPRPRRDEVVEVTIAPDLAIEILSPGQTLAELNRKLRSAIRGGVPLGWLIIPRKAQLLVFQGDPSPQILQSGEIVTGGEVLPGVRLPIDEIFGWLDTD